MYVSMNPSGETGKAIHISQDDTNREVEFIPFDQNGLVKTTSDETVAHINSIKGNTVSFNQILSTSTYSNSLTDTKTFFQMYVQLPVSPYTLLYQGDISTTGVYEFIATAKVSGKYRIKHNGSSIDLNIASNINLVANHKYFFSLNITGYNPSVINGLSYTNGMIFDLTLMGIDNLTTTAEVEAWLSSHIGDLPYFDYTQGTLISFMGSGLKTENADQTESNTLSLPTSTYFPTGMKDCSQSSPVYDEMNLTIGKGYERVGSVDLGTLNWETSVINNVTRMRTSQISNIKHGDSNNYIANAIIFKYKVNTVNLLYTLSNDKQFGVDSNGRIYILDSDYTDAATFKQMLIDQNVKLYYELTTPTEFDISLDLTYPVENGGTEQILPVNGSTPTTAPIKANITYPDRTEDTEFLYKQTSFEWIYKNWSFVCKNITQALSVVGNALKGTIPGTMTSESGKYPLKLKMTDNDGVCFSEKIDLFVEKKP